jgi:hypothetical protein
MSEPISLAIILGGAVVGVVLAWTDAAFSPARNRPWLALAIVGGTAGLVAGCLIASILP